MRNDYSIVRSVLPPWVFKAAVNTSLSFENACRASRFGYLKLDADQMSTFDGLFEEFGSGLSFPDYYGRNSAALHECLTDLSWLPFSGYLLAITHPTSILSRESASEVSWLLAFLEDVCEEWSRPICLGEEWDRPATPFHVVFFYEQNELSSIPVEIAALPELHC